MAYVMMAFSVAYFKRHYPAEFYAVYYTVRADAFDITQAEGGPERILQNIIKLSGPEATAKDKDVVTILEVVYEMNLRGIELLPVDIYKSEALRFTVEDFDMAKVSELYARPEYRGALRVEAGSKPCLSLRLKAKSRVIDEARRFAAAWGG